MEERKKSVSLCVEEAEDQFVMNGHDKGKEEEKG